MEKTLLIGASGLAQEVLALTRAGSTHVVFGILDDGWADMGESFAGVPVLGGIERAADYIDIKLLICVGSGGAREAIVDRLALLGVSSNAYTTVVDPSVSDHDSSAIGEGSVVLANAVLTADVSIGNHVVVMPNVTFTHGNAVDDFATVAAGATFGGDVRIGRCAYIGMNASVKQRVHVGDYAVLGMGAALTKHLPAGETWAGVPARPLHDPHHSVAPTLPATDAASTTERSS
ncbi:sugar O-acyltransferase (sialic acid O-acetyltransferase NeuD family) [Okibacterium sp. HSC-33S16]|uniref:NeuD/PglB/VioB family sugar acetyltransferase n=1 Tax=Okibacterium sp. HSC-33S16 TaxID=2910965 RepID=UPI0020A1819D|nr:NeuD/PglB/VioB family sugar acetyltransferase [Okibacterium sp. HSC-33S16]MCP2031548.1 sugar O-acyltransferase (sialic acid O-acetyltransferase NeuD family) [Okibacterium sp. HSC-33S16]